MPSTPATEAERRGLQALGEAINELRQAQEAGDQPTVWRRTLEVLNLMHSLDDQAHKRLGPDYREVIRRASEDGRTQAALTLVRGIAHHHGSEVQAHVFREPKMYVRRPPGAKGVPRRQGGIGARRRAPVVAPVRPPSLHGEEMHDRDAYYARHVEGRGLMEPLVSAQRFLAKLQQPSVTGVTVADARSPHWVAGAAGDGRSIWQLAPDRRPSCRR